MQRTGRDGRQICFAHSVPNIDGSGQKQCNSADNPGQSRSRSFTDVYKASTGGWGGGVDATKQRFKRGRSALRSNHLPLYVQVPLSYNLSEKWCSFHILAKSKSSFYYISGSNKKIEIKRS